MSVWSRMHDGRHSGTCPGRVPGTPEPNFSRRPGDSREPERDDGVRRNVESENFMTTRKIKPEPISFGLPWWEEMLRGQRNGLLAGSLRSAARLGSWGYKVGVRGRELAYESGLLK